MNWKFVCALVLNDLQSGETHYGEAERFLCYNALTLNISQETLPRMERKLHSEPAFDMDNLRATLDTWKAGGANRIVLEWSTGTGPNVFFYPAGQRKLGVHWTAAVETYAYNEVYADFIELTLLPRLAEAARARGFEATVLCVDLQPLQVQRQRRRQIERTQTATASH